MFSLITLSEVDCRNLSIRDIGYFTYKKKMGKGNNFYNGKPKKKLENLQKKVQVYIF